MAATAPNTEMPAGTVGCYHGQPGAVTISCCGLPAQSWGWVVNRRRFSWLFFLSTLQFCVLLPCTWSWVRSLPRCTLMFPQECFNRAQSDTVSQNRQALLSHARTLKHTRVTILYSTSMKTLSILGFLFRIFTADSNECVAGSAV
jgi:hypothetical protein